MPPTSSRPRWRPTEILRFVRSVPSSTGAAVVVTDAGEGYLKAMGNAEGEHALASEYLATQLAEWFGLRTFDFALIEVTEADEIQLPNGRVASPGPAFITRSEKGEPWGGKERELKRLENVSDISRLVVFDTWVRNRDRYTPLPTPRRRLDNVFLSGEASAGKLSLRAMDHTHCFGQGGELTPKISHLDEIQDPLVYGLFPEFRKFCEREIVQSAANALKEVPQEVVEGFVQSIPPEWDVSNQTRDCLVEFVTRRAAYVADRIIVCIWPQGGLEFPDEAEDER